MMAHYWENFSPFALDLAGAVLRQGVFTAKMHQIDWLHSPARRETMARLLAKYHRFVALMQLHPDKVCVPTLDVDLAWHTHQLAPRDYYQYTTAKTNQFVDHDDKMDEDELSQGFEWTTKAYQARYAEVYSECTCWYCETVRSRNTGSLAEFLRLSTQAKAARDFHDSGRASLCPPDESAHISAHSAVRNKNEDDSSARRRHDRQLELHYQKARGRAHKKGRTLPPRELYYDYWGYQYHMYSPAACPMHLTPGLYPGWDPGAVSTGTGSWPNCATGSYGGAGVSLLSSVCLLPFFSSFFLLRFPPPPPLYLFRGVHQWKER